MTATCSVDDCEKPAEKRTWCAMHYRRWLKHGDTSVVLKVRDAGPPEVRVWKKITATPFGCWQWGAAIDPQGYGTFSADRNRIAHRYVYELLVGPIGDGLQIDHLCRNRGCVNPDHLEPVTAKVNTNRSRARDRFLARTHCDKGHELTPDNVLPGGGRTCRECARIWHREYSRAQRGSTRTYDASNGDKTHCMHGHEFTPENTYVSRTGRRDCRTCARRRQRERAARKRAKASDLT